MRVLTESTKLSVYKKLLRMFSEYSSRYPATGITKYFTVLRDKGIKVLPKCEIALNILDSLIDDNNYPASVQKLLNTRFADVDEDVKPIINGGRRKVVAFWTRNGKLYDKVISLLNIEGKGQSGNWSDVEGNKVEILNLAEEA